MDVLLIEGSRPVAERLAELFTAHKAVAGFHAVRPDEFVTALPAGFVPQIVLLGVTYPVTASFHLLKRIRMMCPVAVIMLDNGTNEHAHLHFLKHGATHVIDTYNDFGQLLQIVEEIVPLRKCDNNRKNCSDE